MAKNAGCPRSTDNLLQVAGFLKQADKLVRERNYPLALEQIAKARAKDPTNSYAEAYEQRVQLLLGALGDRNLQRANLIGADSNTSHTFSQHLESIANLAIHEAHRTAKKSLQQPLNNLEGDPRLKPACTANHTSKNDKESMGREEDEVCRAVRAAEELFRSQRLDEALNSLAPAILLDPLNESILQLERQIRDARGEEWMTRVLQHQREKDFANRPRKESEIEIQKCILRATHLTERKEFSEALMVIGQGYLLDPFSEPLAMCEKMILSAIGRDASFSGWQHATRDHLTLEVEPRPSETKPTIVQYLDKAQDYVNEDRFAEALSQVALALIAAQNDKRSSENNAVVPARVENANRVFADPDGVFRLANHQDDGISRQIFVLLDKAKRLASKKEFDSALEALLQASFLIPSDGSLEELDREIARKFMEYHQLMRPGRITRSTQDRAITVTDATIALGDRSSVKDGKHSTDKTAGMSRDNQDSSRRIEPQLDLENLIKSMPEDGISEMRLHLLRSLHHLNNMKLIEASVEAEIATLKDESRGDIASFSLAVARLSRKAKAQIPLNALNETYELIRQQAKDLIYSLWYEEILKGMSQSLELLPTSDILLRRREEVKRSFEEFNQSTGGTWHVDEHPIESSKKNSTVSKKMRRRSFDQMGLSFSENPDANEEIDDSRSGEYSNTTEATAAQKSIRNVSTGTSRSTYLGN